MISNWDENIRIDTIIWDWNGTLLNDTTLCVDAMNSMLTERGKSNVSVAQYRDYFTFPVKDYYSRIGWDFEEEPFDKIGIEFMDLYFQDLEKADLQDDTIDALEFFKEKGVAQYVLSAMEEQSLISSIKKKGIFDYFSAITGINDHYANGKIASAGRLIRKIASNPEEIVLIGDTLHDLEVANHFNLRCFLIAKGHQSKEKLGESGGPVFDSLSELVRLWP